MLAGQILRTDHIRNMNSLVCPPICVFLLLLLAGNIHLIHAADDDDNSNANFLRLPVSEVGVAAASVATNIIGRDGLCLDVTNGNYADGTPVQLYPCGQNQSNQLWSFESDGTIRSNGKCLTPNGNYAMIYVCEAASQPCNQNRQIWGYNYIGTITNFVSGLVLSSLNATIAPGGRPVTLAKDENLPFQAWTAVNYAEPALTYISGGPFGYCLNADNYLNVNDYVRVRCCEMRMKPQQQWAIYGDRTIRFFSDKSLCLTSNGLPTNYIQLKPCQGLPTQRWNFVASSDGHNILNPDSGFFLNVYGGLFELNIIEQTPGLKQEWYIPLCPDCPYTT